MFNNKKSKVQKGIIISDALIAILLVLLFTGIITSLIVNIVLESTKIKISSQQIDFATEILEYVEQISYENVTQAKLIDYVNNKGLAEVSAGATVEGLTTSYRIGIQVEKYIPTNESLPKLDIIKKVTITVENTVEDKQYSTIISTLKKATIDEVKAKL